MRASVLEYTQSCAHTSLPDLDVPVGRAGLAADGVDDVVDGGIGDEATAAEADPELAAAAGGFGG